MDIEWTSDPIADWDRYCEEQERELRKYPTCSHCGEHVTDVVYEIDGERYCEDCLNELFAVEAEALREE